MSTVREILEEKGREVWSVGPDTTVFETVKVLAERGIGALLVTEGERVIGIVSERDYARKVAIRGESSREMPVRSIMTSEVVCVAPDQTVDECMGLMTDRRIRHLPVVEDERLVGVVSIGDIVKAVIADREVKIEQLECYIRGG